MTVLIQIITNSDGFFIDTVTTLFSKQNVNIIVTFFFYIAICCYQYIIHKLKGLELLFHDDYYYYNEKKINLLVIHEMNKNTSNIISVENGE